jgi:VanZ family protein
MSDKPTLTPRLRWTLWLTFLAAWTTALLLPGYLFPPKLVSQRPFQIPLGKILHVTCYAILAGTIPGLPLARRGRWTLLAALSPHCFASEFLQNFVPSRGPSLFDVGLDHAGLLLGIVLVWPWQNWSGRGRNGGRDDPRVPAAPEPE